MIVTVSVTSNFKRQVKPLLKKYPSLRNELIDFENKLHDNPRMGTPLGKSAYKIRLKVKSKGRGKSSGLRIISYVEEVVISLIEIYDKEVIVYLLAIYYKTEISTITDNELKELIFRLK